MCPFPVTCRFPEKLDLASSGEGYGGVIIAVTDSKMSYCLRLSQRGQWVLFISGTNSWESRLFWRIARHSETGLLCINNSP